MRVVSERGRGIGLARVCVAVITYAVSDSYLSPLTQSRVAGKDERDQTSFKSRFRAP